jgi:selenocysteine lyase/cysteine desulfurase
VMGYRLQLAEVRGLVADYVGAKAEDIVIVENASSGINAVLRSLFPYYLPGTKLLRLSLAYPMVQHTMSYIADMGKLDIIDVVIDIPTDEATIIKGVEEAFAKYGHGEIALAVFDHICSMPMVIMPIKKLIDIAHSHGSLVLVDGAHAIGQVPLNLTYLNPDFYTSNGHKWLCAPKGAAFLYVKKEHHSVIHPTVISNQYGNGWDLVHQFEYVGTRDYSAFLTLTEAIQFRKNLTDQVVWNYNNNLCLEAGKMMSAAWNTTRPFPDSMVASMINVRIPCNTKDPSKGCYTWNEPELYLWMIGHNVWSLVYPDQSGFLYVRLSCQIYNDMDDYVKLLKVISEYNLPEK